MVKSASYKYLFTKSPYIILGFITLGFGLDFINKIDIYYARDFIKYSRFLKLIMAVYGLIFIITHLKYISNKIKYFLYTFLLLNLMFVLKYDYWSLYIDEYLRYMFILYVFPLLHYTFFENRQYIIQNFYLIIKYFVIFNSLAILLGLVFDITVFQSYNSNRFGFNGILLSQGLTPYVYLSATILFWTRNEKKMLFLILVLSLLSGIKGVYLAEILLLIFLVFMDEKFSIRNKLKWGIILLAFFILIIIGLFQLSPFKEVLVSKGFFSAIFSLRNDNLFELVKTITANNFNLLIGAIGLEKVRLELQMIDIFLFFGVLGLFVFIYFLISFYKVVVLSFQSKSFFFSAILLSLLSGNLFYVPLSSILFFITLFSLYHNIKSKNFENGII